VLMRFTLGRSSAAQRKYQGELAVVTHAYRKLTKNHTGFRQRDDF
jgi:hypothetical protein